MAQPETIGRYRIEREIGRGGMGVVYLGRDPELDRPVAVKVIDGATAGADPDREARFLREARLAARIDHPNVVPVYDSGREGDALFLVMAWVDGDSLEGRIARGAWPSRQQALELAAAVAEALAAAHDLGVVHRDVKPSNILIGRDGRVRVTDFGVAKAIGESTELTRTGTTVGSPSYMAPEQVRGEPLDGRADLFSLGVVLYQLLLKRKPFPADTLTTLVYQILHHDPLGEEAAAELPAVLGELLGLCLAKDRDRRIADATTLAARFRSAATALGAATTRDAQSAPTAVVTPQPLTSTVGPPPAGPRRLPVILMGLGAVAVLTLAAIYLRPGGTAPPPGGPEGAVEPTPTATVAEPAAIPPDLVPSPTGEPTVSRPAAVPASTPRPRRPTPRPTPVPAPVEAAPSATHAPPPPATATTTPLPPAEHFVYCQSAVEFHLDPEETEIVVDGRVIGTSDEWDGAGGGRAWTPAGHGAHYVQLRHPGYRSVWVKITLTPFADEEICEVEVDLSPSR